MRRREFVAGTLAVAGCAATPGSTTAPEPPAAVPPPPPQEPSWPQLQGLAGGIAPADADEYAEHRRRVRAQMKAHKLGALVVEPGATMTYLSGVQWGLSERPFLLVLPVEGEPSWVCPAFEVRTASEQLGDAEVLAWHEHESPFARVLDALAQRKLGGERVVVDPFARSFIARGLSDVLGGPVGSGASVVTPARARKTPAELARLRRANMITKAALEVASQKITPGMRQSEAAALIRAAQEAGGLDRVWVLALFGPAAAFPHGTREDRVLAPDDLILVDTGGGLHGYRSDITRTWAVGKPGDEARRAWETVARAQAAGLEKIRKGAACGDPDAAARAVVAKAGYGELYEKFTHRLGHGIGLQVHEPPYLVKDSAFVLQPGMTMSNEPGIYAPGEFGVRIEDIVAVTDDGVEVFGPGVGDFSDPLAGHLAAAQTAAGRASGSPAAPGRRSRSRTRARRRSGSAV